MNDRPKRTTAQTTLLVVLWIVLAPVALCLAGLLVLFIMCFGVSGF